MPVKSKSKPAESESIDDLDAPADQPPQEPEAEPGPTRPPFTGSVFTIRNQGAGLYELRLALDHPTGEHLADLVAVAAQKPRDELAGLASRMRGDADTLALAATQRRLDTTEQLLFGEPGAVADLEAKLAEALAADAGVAEAEERLRDRRLRQAELEQRRRLLTEQRDRQLARVLESRRAAAAEYVRVMVAQSESQVTAARAGLDAAVSRAVCELALAESAARSAGQLSQSVRQGLPEWLQEA